MTAACSPPAPPETLDIAPDHPVVPAAALHWSSRGLFLLRRGPNDKRNRNIEQVISVQDSAQDEVVLSPFLQPTVAAATAIVDTADEMNANAANALLKLLEEPPESVTLLPDRHQPSRLLPTIRSRCRELRLGPLGPDDLAAALHAAGGASHRRSAGLGRTVRRFGR